MKKTLAIILSLLMALSVASIASAETVEAIPVTLYYSGYVGTWANEQEYIDNVEQMFYEDTGILLDFTLLGTSHEDSYSFISTKIAGGELDFAKSASPAYMQQLAVDGYLMPLDDLFAEYGQDITAAVNPLGFEFGVVDGQNYLIPYIGDYSMYVCTWVRWDLFEDSGYTELPTTVTELVDMMYKVMADHADMQLVGVTSRYPNWPWQHSFCAFYPYADNNYNFTSCDENGEPYECIYGSNLPMYFNMPEYADFLTQLAQWYQDGIIHNEIFTMDQTQYDALIGQDRCFVVTDGWDFQSTADKKAGLDPNFPLAEGQTAQDWRLLSLVNNDLLNADAPMVWAAGLEGLQTGYGGIIDGCEHATELMTFFNWCYGGEEIYRAISWGVEGTHWDWDENNKKYTYKDEAGTSLCSGCFGSNVGNFYLPYSMETTMNYYGTEWQKVFGEKNVDWTGFFQDHSTLAFTPSDTLTLTEMQNFAGEKVVEILTCKTDVETGLQELRDGLKQMGWDDYWTEYTEQYKTGMTAKYGEDYAHHE